MTQKFILKCILALCLLGNSLSFAAPLTCVPLKVKTANHNLILENPTAKTQVFFLKNNSAKSLWMDRLSKQASASANWSSFLRPHNWSAFVLDKKEFVINCAVIQPGAVDYVNCAEAISVCTPGVHTTINIARKGSHWLVEDKPWDVFVGLLQKRGVK